MIRTFLRAVLWTVELAALLAAGALAALTLVMTSTYAAGVTGAVPLAMDVTSAMPSWLAMLWVLPSPLGGVFRTDFLLLACVCAILARVAGAVRRALS